MKITLPPGSRISFPDRQQQLTRFQDSRNAVLNSRKREVRIIPELGAPYDNRITASEIYQMVARKRLELAHKIAIYHQRNSAVSYCLARELDNEPAVLLMQAHGAEASRRARVELGIE